MHKRKITYTISLFLVLAILFVIFFPLKKVISISNKKKPSQKVYISKAYDDGFCISYTHSVNKGRVHDYYEVDKKNDDLILISSLFVSYGAGIPELEETEGASFKEIENGYLMYDINRHVPQVLMAVGLIANHTFCVGKPFLQNTSEQEIAFTDFFEAQTSVIIKCKKVSLFELFLYGLKKG